jgi:thiamine biosynthesis protein ThiI
MYNSISISLGEMVLKGKNRGQFEQKLNKQINKVIKEKGLKLYRDRGKVFVDAGYETEEIIKDIKNIFGIAMISPCVKISTELEEIKKAVIEVVKEEINKKEIRTFKIAASRADKKYNMNSIEINKLLGGVVLDNFENIKVDVHNPDLMIYVDIRSFCYIATEKIKGAGGLPLGTNGEGIVLLSGGIDSPVAAYMMARRGVNISCLTFHAYPFTSENANEKVKSLVERLSVFCGPIKLYSINMLDIYKSIKMNCPDEQSTIIARRIMMKIGQLIAESDGQDFLITGESLGQVASQTAKSLGVIDASVDIPILRPLIGMDKTEIISIARDIGTYEISILPFDDCCSVFSPAHPLTRPKKDKIEDSENNLRINDLINEALANMEKEYF